MKRKTPIPAFWRGTDAAYRALLSKIAERIRSDCSRLDGPLVKPLCVRIVRILNERTKGAAIVEETPWDTSAHGALTDERFSLDDYSTVGEFLDNALTGDTIATYTPGSGLAAETYGDLLAEEMFGIFLEFLRTEYPDLISEEGYIEDDVLDDLSCLGIFDFAPIEAVRDLRLKEFHARFLPAALEDQAAEQRQRETRENQARARAQALVELAGDLPAQISAFAANRQFNKGNWQALLEFLRDLTEKHGKERVSAAMRLVHLSVSNSVARELAAQYPRPTLKAASC